VPLIILGHSGLKYSGNFFLILTVFSSFLILYFFFFINYRVDYGHEEVRVKFGKDPRQYSTTTKEFIGDVDGNIKGVNTVQVEWTRTPTGGWSMKEVPGSEKYYQADLILLAMGFLGPEKTISSELSLKLDNRGNIETLDGIYGTENPKIFAAGGKLLQIFWIEIMFLISVVIFSIRLSSRTIISCMGNI